MKKSYSIAILVVIAMLVVAGALVGCKKKNIDTEPIPEPQVQPEPEPVEPEPVVPEGATIELNKFDISEKDVVVEPGATVTWVNKGETKHKIQIKKGTEVIESSEILEMDDTYSYLFEEAGEYTWLSGPFAGIVRGTVTVK